MGYSEVMNNKVNFLIIGTQKAGTTSLYQYIRQHKDIYFSDLKEVTYFVQDELYAKGEEYYHSFFQNYDGEKVVASAYVHMLPCIKCPERVKKYNPDMRFIVMLRDPIKRAYSAYNYAIKNGWENKKNSFEETIGLEKNRVENEEYNLMYFENGQYYKHIKRWQESFPKENFLLIKDTDLKNNSEEVLKKIFLFLGIGDYSARIDVSKEFNRAGVVHSSLLQSFLTNKNLFVKKMLGRLLPAKLRVWIRVNVIRKVIQFNQIDKENTKLEESRYNAMKILFQEDAKNLKNELEIELF